ncbi:hypothetical protein BJ741DRAFT_703873 [Chytriomyces cf. hyalinus JEL632]|nr:hypothetical protein BJ741DRAFT_703873 [Chytriomyces cf. hyalinus JEL632]
MAECPVCQQHFPSIAYLQDEHISACLINDSLPLCPVCAIPLPSLNSSAVWDDHVSNCLRASNKAQSTSTATSTSTTSKKKTYRQQKLTVAVSSDDEFCAVKRVVRIAPRNDPIDPKLLKESRNAAKQSAKAGSKTKKDPSRTSVVLGSELELHLAGRYAEFLKKPEMSEIQLELNRSCVKNADENNMPKSLSENDASLWKLASLSDAVSKHHALFQTRMLSKYEDSFALYANDFRSSISECTKNEKGGAESPQSVPPDNLNKRSAILEACNTDILEAKKVLDLKILELRAAYDTFVRKCIRIRNHALETKDVCAQISEPTSVSTEIAADSVNLHSSPVSVYLDAQSAISSTHLSTKSSPIRPPQVLIQPQLTNESKILRPDANSKSVRKTILIEISDDSDDNFTATVPAKISLVQTAEPILQSPDRIKPYASLATEILSPSQTLHTRLTNLQLTPKKAKENNIIAHDSPMLSASNSSHDADRARWDREWMVQGTPQKNGNAGLHESPCVTIESSERADTCYHDTYEGDWGACQSPVDTFPTDVTVLPAPDNYSSQYSERDSGSDGVMSLECNVESADESDLEAITAKDILSLNSCSAGLKVGGLVGGAIRRSGEISVGALGDISESSGAAAVSSNYCGYSRPGASGGASQGIGFSSVSSARGKESGNSKTGKNCVAEKTRLPKKLDALEALMKQAAEAAAENSGEKSADGIKKKGSKSKVGAGGTSKRTTTKNTASEAKPDYQSMSIPELEKIAGKYGIRKLPKAALVNQLEKIWVALHPAITSVEQVQGDGANTVQPEESSTKVKGKAKAKPKKAARKGETEAEDVDIEDVLFNFIKADGNLYNQILLYKPIDFDQLHQRIKEDGVKCNKKVLQQFLDARGIVIQNAW